MYRLKDKRKRNEKLMSYHYRGYTQRAIAGIFHISQAMVWKIINREKYKEMENG